jgi:radical SAM family uncharacterized protein
VSLNLLSQVTCPARYAGGEWNEVKKDKDRGLFRFAMCFPDAYEVGMSHLGSKILYHEINKRDDAMCERVFCPWVDMEEALDKSGQPLESLENHIPLDEFDMVGFTLQYELTFTNILTMLHLGRIPLVSCERTPEHPIVIAGGPCAYNPEPLSPYIDAFVIGEGEEVIHAVVDTVRRLGRSNRAATLRALAQVPGVYVPSLYDVTYNTDGTVRSVMPNAAEAPEMVYKRVVKDMESCDYPTAPVVPFTDVVHDRANVEIFRGCTRGCRFCQAGAIYRPVRERSNKRVVELAGEILRNTGYDEVGLTSLSSSDYSGIDSTVDELLAAHEGDRIGVSLPSLRVDAFSVGLAERVQRVRRSGLTFAPEAGTQRMRDVINKNVSADDIRTAAEAAFQAGWNGIKLYFMIGLPTETEEDVRGIAETAIELSRLSRKGRGRPANITVSVATFVPKAHTPFQWEPQDTIDMMREKQAVLKNMLRANRIAFDWHEPLVSFIEAVFARGDRRLAPAIKLAWENGARFDGWNDRFKFEAWTSAFASLGIDPAFYANRRRQFDEVLPWDHVSPGLSKEWLVSEHERALGGEITPDCRTSDCTGCGVCPSLEVLRVVAGVSR